MSEIDGATEAEDLTPPMPGQLYAKVEKFTKSDGQFVGVGTKNETVTPDITQANVITSMVEANVTKHKVIIDLDLPAQLIPSTTPGHFHLYIDHEMEKDAYFTLLHALSEAGLVEEGYVGASERRGYTAVRLPWIKKDPKQEAQFTETRKPGHHEWEVGQEFCVCGHPSIEHTHEVEEVMTLTSVTPILSVTTITCNYEGCDDPDPFALGRIA